MSRRAIVIGLGLAAAAALATSIIMAVGVELVQRSKQFGEIA